MVAHKQMCNSAQCLGLTGQTLPAQMCVFDIPLEVCLSSLTVFLGSYGQGPPAAACEKLCLAQVSMHTQLTWAASAGLGFVTASSVWWHRKAKCALMDLFLYQWCFCSVVVLLLRREGHAGSVLFLAMLVIIRQNHPIIRCYIAV